MRCGTHRFVNPLPMTGRAWPFQRTGAVRVCLILSASAADSAGPKIGRPWTSTTTANS